jgi:alkylation response protein AidB-like acyl-CoA dehydrogenase
VNLEPSDEQVALRDTVRRALAAEPADRAWERLGSLGALDVLVPESSGGSGLGMVEAAIVSEEMGRALYSGPWLATAVAAVRAAAAAGAPFVPQDRTATLALPWPGHGAGFSLDGAGRVTGVQDHVLGAPLAGVLLLPAMRGGEMVLVAVEGVEAVAEPGLDPTTPLGTVTVDGVSGEVLGTLPDGALEVLRDDVLVAWAADGLGAARAVLALAVEHAKMRHQFGQPIGAFQAVQHLLVDALRPTRANPPNATSRRCASRPSPAGSPPSATSPSRSSAASATPGSTPPTGASGACWGGRSPSARRRPTRSKWVAVRR